METYRFIRLDNRWYIDLPEYLEQGGNMADLQMVEGADIMLDTMANGKDSVNVTISKEPFDSADTLTLIERCDPAIGGGIYLMKSYAGQSIDQAMWLCGVTEFVLGNIPEQIFVRRESQIN